MLALMSTVPLDAQVVTDGSLGRAGALQGPNFAVPRSLGRQVGGNLFHSFSQLSLAPGESLTFSAPTGTGVHRVVARVTGGQESNIDGTLRVSIPGADFLFINPAGIAFGPSGRLDVSGAITLSTADHIRFADGTIFHATRDSGETLTDADPIALGFESRAPASIRVTGAVSATLSTLDLGTGRTLTMVAGNVRVTDAQIVTEGGRIRIVTSAGRSAPSATSDGAPDVVSIDPTSSSTTPSTGGSTALVNSRLLASNGGSIQIRSGDVTLQASSLSTQTRSAPGGFLDVGATGTMLIDHSSLSANTTGLGNSGGIAVAARDLILTGLSPNAIRSISADSDVFDETLEPFDATRRGGNGGNIAINVGSLSISAQAVVSALTDNLARGGDIQIAASRFVEIDGSRAQSKLTGIAAETVNSFATGAGGNISITSPTIKIRSNGEITSTTKGLGPAGDITLNASDELSISQHGFPGFTGIQSRVGLATDKSGASGTGGVISITAGKVSLVDGGVITATSFGQGPGGAVNLTAKSLNITGPDLGEFTGVYSRSTFPTNGGKSGAVTLTLDNLLISGHSPGKTYTNPISPSVGVIASSIGDGDSGSLLLHVRNDIRLTGPTAQINVQANHANADKIDITTRNLNLRSGAQINASAKLTGGQIQINAFSLYALDSKITAAAGGDGTFITLNAGQVLLNDTLVDGRNGPRRTPVRVTIPQNSVFLRSTDSPILSNSISLPAETDVASSLASLDAALVDPSATLREQCALTLTERISTFIVVGRGGVPPQPGGWLDLPLPQKPNP